ncbi:MAG: hypothetical protein H6513_14650 [Acidimicrobiaceae bacterium]|nr:hypothetical protein [Acidimicrobiaceae bacterium]
MLAFSGSGDVPGATTGFQWRLRRTGTDGDQGLTYVTHEAIGLDDTAPQVHLVFNRLGSRRRWRAAGHLVPPDASALLAGRRSRWRCAAGFAEVQVHGGDDGWVALATA